MSLPDVFLARPIAHRGYHRAGAAENSRAAFERAIAAGYVIELDLQLSADGVAMVFHDYDLRRLTGQAGAVRSRTAAELSEIALMSGGGTIPTFEDVLGLIDGRVPLLIELKDQDGAMGPNIGALEEATATVLKRYAGPAAVMSFNPHSVAGCRDLMPDTPRGLVTSGYKVAQWPTLPAATRALLRDIPDADRVGACFVSHDVRDLAAPRLQELRQQGLRILCWTVRTARQEARARRVADNITFEHYAA